MKKWNQNASTKAFPAFLFMGQFCCLTAPFNDLAKKVNVKTDKQKQQRN